MDKYILRAYEYKITSPLFVTQSVNKIGRLKAMDLILKGERWMLERHQANRIIIYKILLKRFKK